jgi:hypothetical protein
MQRRRPPAAWQRLVGALPAKKRRIGFIIDED